MDRFLLLALSAFSFGAFAGKPLPYVYKCEKDGVTVFSQTKCGKNTKLHLLGKPSEIPFRDTGQTVRRTPKRVPYDSQVRANLSVGSGTCEKTKHGAKFSVRVKNYSGRNYAQGNLIVTFDYYVQNRWNKNWGTTEQLVRLEPGGSDYLEIHSRPMPPAFKSVKCHWRLKN